MRSFKGGKQVTQKSKDDGVLETVANKRHLPVGLAYFKLFLAMFFII